ncbi:hypothetical protein CMI37_35270 [Candidatus Pacearchaeota archaeon]|nr:hypothetical protein [Candidatus Pacearchaeota archaeon]|tara:strand:+ start:193 stop:564 length:372 start_codon:yes stop_codon:yes gene_type:complete
MKILLDTNFLLTTAKQKIDFDSLANQLFDQEIEWVVPLEVLKELKQLAERQGEKTADKESAKLALQLVDNFDNVPLGTDTVDNGIVRYAKNNQVIIATLDRNLKKRFDNKILTIRGKKSLEII